MAQLFTSGTAKPGYCGLPSIFEYTNDDGRLCNTNCGQAAAATFLTHLGIFAPLADRAASIMRYLETHFPPDNIFGMLGTSRRRIERMCRSIGVPLQPIAGREALCAQLRESRPVIVMLGVSGGRFWKWDLPGGHWMVASGYDDNHVYLTNCGMMTWSEFEHGWNALAARLINMHNKGLVARTQ